MSDQDNLSRVPFSGVPRATYGEDGVVDRWLTEQAIAWLDDHIGAGRWFTQEYDGQTVLVFYEENDAGEFVIWATR
jgi:hypothetical protein